MTTTHKAYIAPILRAIIDEPAINIKHVFKKDPNIYYLPRSKTTKESLAQAIACHLDPTQVVDSLVASEVLALQILQAEYNIDILHKSQSIQGGYIAIPYESEYKIIVPLN